MLSCLDEDFLKMLRGFVAIVVLALISFYLLNYFSQDPAMQEVVSSIFESVLR